VVSCQQVDRVEPEKVGKLPFGRRTNPPHRRGGRVAECGGLLISRNPLLVARFQLFIWWHPDCVDRI